MILPARTERERNRIPQDGTARDVAVGGDGAFSAGADAVESPAPVTGAGDGHVSSGEQLGDLHEAALTALDKLVALLGLVLASPLLLAIAVAIKVDSPGPVFYRQLRVGRDRRRGSDDAGDVERSRRTLDLGGRPFVIYKFRTMHVGAEADCGPTWGSPDDDRTTRVGRFLRRHRLDELPQLYNVLRGDMSIVGPRPERPAIFRDLREEIGRYPRRQRVRPGITGWAQINRPTDQTVDDVQHKLEYDLEYVERRSLWFDVRIMLRTPLVMARPELLRRSGTGGAAATGGGDAPDIEKDHARGGSEGADRERRPAPATARSEAAPPQLLTGTSDR